MLHLVLYVLLAIIVAVGLFLAATRFLPAGEQIAPAIRDEPLWELPAERSMRPEDVDSVRLPVALRGYRFAETDILLDRLAGELRARDSEIARLRGEPDPAVAAPEPTNAPAANAREAEAPEANAREAEAREAEAPEAEAPEAEAPEAEAEAPEAEAEVPTADASSADDDARFAPPRSP